MKRIEKKDVRELSPDDAPALQGQPGFHARNVIAPLVCVLGALMIWLYVMANDSPGYEQTFYSVPVSVIGASELESNTGMSVVSGQGHIIDVTVSGKKSDVVRLSSGDISAYVNVADLANPDKYTLNVSVAVPSGFAITAVTPNNVTVNVDKTSSVLVPLVAKLTSYTIEADYVLGTPQPEIEEISVSGPVAALSAIDHAEVVIGDLGQLTDSATASGTVHLVDADGDEITNQYVKMAQDTVRVTVPVNMYKELPVEISYKYGYYNDNTVSISVSPATLRVRGEVNALKAMNSYQIVVDEKKITRDTTINESVTLPADIENADKIESVTLEIKHKNTSTRDIVINDIQLNNPNELNCQVTTKSLTIRFRGDAEQLSRLSEENISVTADLANLANNAGVVTVPVTVHISDSTLYTVYEIGDYKAELRIS